jgi:hypothetical protein
VKKSDRQKKAETRKQNTERYRAQDAAVELFVQECRQAMTKQDYEHHLADIKAHAGNMLHIFDGMIDALGMTATEITPPLRKAIENVLEAHSIQRSEMESLAVLCYDNYWKAQYGYDD